MHTSCTYSDQSGDVDWNTLGKILTAHLLGEVSITVSLVPRPLPPPPPVTWGRG